jgi:hypothetical protein
MLLAAALVVPPSEPGAGWAPLKSNTITFRSVSPVKSPSGPVSNCWKRLIAVGAEKMLRETSLSLLAVRAAGSADVVLQSTQWGWANMPVIPARAIRAPSVRMSTYAKPD